MKAIKRIFWKLKVRFIKSISDYGDLKTALADKAIKRLKHGDHEIVYFEKGTYDNPDKKVSLCIHVNDIELQSCKPY